MLRKRLGTRPLRVKPLEIERIPLCAGCGQETRQFRHVDGDRYCLDCAAKVDALIGRYRCEAKARAI